MNDGGKLEVVRVSAHNSSEFNTVVLRPMGRLESTNKQSRGGRADDILECEGGRSDP